MAFAWLLLCFLCSVSFSCVFDKNLASLSITFMLIFALASLSCDHFANFLTFVSSTSTCFFVWLLSTFVYVWRLLEIKCDLEIDVFSLHVSPIDFFLIHQIQASFNLNIIKYNGIQLSKLAVSVGLDTGTSGQLKNPCNTEIANFMFWRGILVISMLL